MSILRAMYTGVTGIAAEGQALGVVGDNIANVNTVGFKQQRAIFADILGGSIGNKNQAGAGVRIASVEQLFTQGALSSTGIATDLALDGDGFFVVSGTVAGTTSNFYTRAGQMRVDKDGNFVNPNGLKLQGYAALPGGGFSAQMGPLTVGSPTIAPRATTSMTVSANLDSNATPPTAPWDPQNPSATSNFATTITVYDSLGTSRSLNVYYRATGNGAWEYNVLADGGSVAGGTPGTNVVVGSGSLSFNPSGALADHTATLPVTVDFAGAEPAQTVNLNFGTPIAAGGTGTDGITQYAAASNVSNQSQDGYAAGELAGVQVDGQGVIRGVFTNGQKLAIGQVAVAKFRSNEGLARAGQNLWAETGESGQALVGAAGAGGRGGISAGTLEQSNVDLASQFVSMIQHQRAFQANSKTITTADEMLQELVNLKR
jgi:flagellar hook protein FlgE